VRVAISDSPPGQVAGGEEINCPQEARLTNAHPALANVVGTSKLVQELSPTLIEHNVYLAHLREGKLP
jgi:hypothetical protein